MKYSSSYLILGSTALLRFLTDFSTMTYSPFYRYFISYIKFYKGTSGMLEGIYVIYSYEYW